MAYKEINQSDFTEDIKPAASPFPKKGIFRKELVDYFRKRPGCLSVEGEHMARRMILRKRGNPTLNSSAKNELFEIRTASLFGEE